MTADDTVTAKLAEWEALVEGATPGPWAVEENDYGEHAVYQDEGDSAFGTAYIAEDIRQGHDEGRADAEFIAAARTAMPALLRFVRKVRKRHEVSPVSVNGGEACAECWQYWPCATEQAARKWIGGEE